MLNDLSDNYKLALEASIKFCGYRERSVKEVENKLIDKRFSRDVIRLTLKKIKGLGFVDNLRFSKSFSRGKNKNNRWGKKKIRYELIAKGLNDNEIQEGIRSIDGDEAVRFQDVIELSKMIKEIEGLAKYI